MLTATATVNEIDGDLDELDALLPHALQQRGLDQPIPYADSTSTDHSTDANTNDSGDEDPDALAPETTRTLETVLTATGRRLPRTARELALLMADLGMARRKSTATAPSAQSCPAPLDS